MKAIMRANTDETVSSGSDGTVEISVPMNSNDFALVKVRRGGKGRKSRAALTVPVSSEPKMNSCF